MKDFLRDHAEIFSFVHTQGLTSDYRLARGRLKRLRDEVSPVARFARNHAMLEDSINFAFDNTFPDCVIRQPSGLKRDIEVTVAQALKRLHLMEDLNREGISRGFLNVPEDASRRCFDRAMTEEPEAYSTEQAIRLIEHDLALRAEGKKFHKGDIPLIEADLEPLPPSRWEEFVGQLAESVRGLAFQEVYLTGRGLDGDIAMLLKRDGDS